MEIVVTTKWQPNSSGNGGKRSNHGKELVSERQSTRMSIIPLIIEEKMVSFILGTSSKVA